MESQPNQNQAQSTFSSTLSSEIQVIVLEPEPANDLPLNAEHGSSVVQLDPPKRKKMKRKRKRRDKNLTRRSSIRCPVCLEHHVTLTVTTLCGHKFCRSCIQRWLTSHHNCPICRRKLRGHYSKPSIGTRQQQASNTPPPDLS
ncbi:hypothetical protein NPIL_168911 [Nephila pilipes]|uniref:RING-type domain-containing protein n=1 Tax=Nephila pilipes TaxID=299642 RepID=A0A8X6PYQ9_NEPPI|nr:hypothetical protein NPIL_168911 [Nephila pilipes]